ncbi:RAD9, HUS1, RAD1-interacting nuclear orphan protein 1 [Oncorhynchus masou masou]|uniref:RAD9, HUS1, RAD1-interacting nuclear orphan protein 1 n=1 Tax=Oncorhynchus masou masou TaxID=90313 RepID=UPI003182C450
MPRKTRKKYLPYSQKPSLLFFEPPLDDARYHNVPQVRGALNPKSFLDEEQRQNSCTACSSWVSPQFDQLPPPAPRGRRGRKKCLSAPSILDRSSHLSRKGSVCKFQALSFQRRSTAQPLHQKHARRKKAVESTLGAHEEQQGLQVHKVGSLSTEYLSNQDETETPTQITSLRKGTAERRRLSEVTPEDAASTSSRCVGALRTSAANVARHGKSPASCSAQTPASATHHTPGTDNVFSPLDVETPELHHDGSSSFLRLLLPASQPMTPPHTVTSEILATDTPERDYGVKVTWRRRKGLMRLLIDRGYLSSAEALISI